MSLLFFFIHIYSCIHLPYIFINLMCFYSTIVKYDQQGQGSLPWLGEEKGKKKSSYLVVTAIASVPIAIASSLDVSPPSYALLLWSSTREHLNNTKLIETQPASYKLG